MDTLTGLLTRKEFEKINISSNIYDTYVVIIDIKRMMEVNDCCGHFVGDEVIIAHAEYLKTLVNRDKLFRVGGNEFALITKIENLNIIIDKISAISTKMFKNYEELENFEEKLLEYKRNKKDHKTATLYISEIYLIGRK